MGAQLGFGWLANEGEPARKAKRAPRRRAMVAVAVQVAFWDVTAPLPPKFVLPAVRNVLPSQGKLPKARKLTTDRGHPRRPLTGKERKFQPESLKILSEHIRPVRRSDCLSGGVNEMRPCPWVSCRHNLAIEVSIHGGIKVRHPAQGEQWEVEVINWDAMHASCVLDIADAHSETGLLIGPSGDGSITVAEVLNLSEAQAVETQGAALGKVRSRARKAGIE